MSPMTRNIALTTAALAVPAALAAFAGPERMRNLPGQMRDLIQDDSVEGQLKRLTGRLNDLSDDLHLHSSRNDQLAQIGRIAAIAGAVLLVPAALAAWFGPRKIAATARHYKDEWTGSTSAGHIRDWGDDLEDLEDDIAEQRDDAWDAVTAKARDLRD